MFIAALFIAVKNGKQPSAGARITNAGVSAQEYYSAIRRDKTTVARTAWEDLRSMTLGGRCQK